MTDLDFGVSICAMLPLVSTLLAGRKWARKYLVGTNDWSDRASIFPGNSEEKSQLVSEKIMIKKKKKRKWSIPIIGHPNFIFQKNQREIVICHHYFFYLFLLFFIFSECCKSKVANISVFFYAYRVMGEDERKKKKGEAVSFFSLERRRRYHIAIIDDGRTGNGISGIIFYDFFLVSPLFRSVLFQSSQKASNLVPW